jgi:hypothetical protein
VVACGGAVYLKINVILSYCFVADAPLHKRFAFVAGNDDDGVQCAVIASESEAIQCFIEQSFWIAWELTLLAIAAIA